MENTKHQKSTAKRPYVTPQIFITHLELECSIAAGSATVRPQDSGQVVFETWDVEQMDDNRSIDF